MAHGPTRPATARRPRGDPLDAADEWYEEDAPLAFHPRDPYRRVDVLESSRHVSVHVDGVMMAETDRPRLLLETGMPSIWYVSLAAVNAERLRPAAQRSHRQYMVEPVVTTGGDIRVMAKTAPEVV